MEAGDSRNQRSAAARKVLISQRFLSQDERVVIADLFRTGALIRQIAQQIDRSTSTISREIRNYSDPATGRYQPFAAHKQSAERLKWGSSYLNANGLVFTYEDGSPLIPDYVNKLYDRLQTLSRETIAANAGKAGKDEIESARLDSQR